MRRAVSSSRRGQVDSADLSMKLLRSMGKAARERRNAKAEGTTMVARGGNCGEDIHLRSDF